MDPLNEVGSRVVEREGDDGRGMLDRDGERVRVEIGNDVIHGEGMVCQVAELAEFALELI
jgi:hypothetical protein